MPISDHPDRRKFLASAMGVSAVALANQSSQARTAEQPAEPRILAFDLATAVPLNEMREFYERSLLLDVVEEHSDRLMFSAGQTRLTFHKAAAGSGQPFYHFAFNIPENKIVAAGSWQRERTPLIPVPAHLRESGQPDHVVNYRHWNAHSVFFFDPAENVVEYIARHDLKNAARGGFGPEDILYASEIGWIVEDVLAAATRLRDVTGLELYRVGSDQFTALGDERGLVLVMKRGRVISLDAKEKKAAGVFRTGIRLRGERVASGSKSQHAPVDYPYSMAVE